MEKTSEYDFSTLNISMYYYLLHCSSPLFENRSQCSKTEVQVMNKLASDKKRAVSKNFPLGRKNTDRFTMIASNLIREPLKFSLKFGFFPEESDLKFLQTIASILLFTHFS